MRWRRLLLRFTFVTLLEAVAMVLGVVLALTLTPPGRALLARVVRDRLVTVLDARVEIGAISGSFTHDLVLRGVAIRDTAGEPLLAAGRLHLRYRLPNLLAGRFVLASVEADSLALHVIKHRSGRLNYEDVLRLGRGPGGGAPPLLRIDALRVTRGTVVVALPWNPPDSARTPAQRAAALAAQRAVPGRVIDSTWEGWRRSTRFDRLDARLRDLVVSTPARDPVSLVIDSLASDISDPQLALRDLRARVRVPRDSVVFEVERAALPSTEVAGAGAVHWPQDTILYDFTLRAPRAALRDLRFISPIFPDFEGSAQVRARSRDGTVTEYAIERLRLARGPASIDGRLVAITDLRRGLGVRAMELAVRDLDLEDVRGYVDTLPFRGTITGPVRGEGLLTDLRVDLALDYADADVEGRPVSHVEAVGRIRSDRRRGLVFDRVEVPDADLAMGTVRRFAPVITLPGRLEGRGTLDGPLADVTFEGTLRVRHAGHPPSEAAGRLRLDTRRPAVVTDADLLLQPLVLAGMREGYDWIPAQGELRGRLRALGTPDTMFLDADVRGEAGHVALAGTLGLDPLHLRSDSLAVEFEGLDLAALFGRGPASRLDGRLEVAGRADSGAAPVGEATLRLRGGRVLEAPLGAGYARVRVADSLIAVDTAALAWPGAQAVARGTLGWAVPHDGRLALRVDADSLAALDSLLLVRLGLRRDSLLVELPLEGRGTLDLAIGGHLDSLDLVGTAGLRQVRFQRLALDSLTAELGWRTGPRPAARLVARADSLSWGTLVFRGSQARFEGPLDSLGWAVATSSGSAARLAASGLWYGQREIPITAVDRFDVDVGSRRWALAAPMAIAIGDSAFAITPLRLGSDDGAATIEASGLVPGPGPGTLAVTVRGLPLHDLAALVQRDTAELTGNVALEASVTGTAREPVLHGEVSVANVVFGETRLPLVQGTFDYDARRLGANLTMWRTGEAVLEARADLPLDLGFVGVERRLVDGPLEVTVRADSADLGVLEAVTPTVRDVGGRVTAYLRAAGTWDEPVLSGSGSISGGAMSLPAANVRYTDIDATVTLAGDSLTVAQARLASGGGTLAATGSVRFPALDRPELALRFEADRFRLFDIRNVAAATVSGRADLRGPFFGARLTGAVEATSGVLYFADLISKSIVDLEDPLNAELIREMGARPRSLRPGAETRFLQQLRADNLLVQLGNDVWLRSGEANINLANARPDEPLRVNKTGRVYRVDGILDARRGTYTLKLGPEVAPVSRRFEVRRGTVRYFGTTDLNAELDLEATYQLRAANAEQFNVIARITGTMLAPRLALSSDAQPPIDESNLVSYLLTGYPLNEAGLGTGQVMGGVGANVAFGAVTGEVERLLMAELGAYGFSSFQFQSSVSGARRTGPTYNQLAIGWRVGNRTFLTLNPGFCSGGGTSAGQVGASIEFRATTRLRWLASVEPAGQACQQLGADATLRYQLSADVFWERDF